MKRLILPILILSFSWASAQEIVSNEEFNQGAVVNSEDVVLNENEDEVAYTAKTLRDPDNIDFDNLHKEKQLELFVTEIKNIIC